MKKTDKKFMLLGLFAVVLLTVMVPLVAATSPTWVLVVQIGPSDVSPYISPLFDITCAEWLVNASYTPSSQNPQAASFVLTVNNQYGNLTADVWIASGNFSTRNITYVYNSTTMDLTGLFSCSVAMSYVSSYTIIIEQNMSLGSVPEFTPLMLTGVLVTVSALAVARTTRVKRVRIKF